MHETGKLDKIDFTRPNKFDSIAELLFAITGKGKESWVEQLKGSRSKGLYEFNNDGEREQRKHRKFFEEIERKRQAVIDAQQLKENELSEFKDLLVKAERWQ